MHIAGRALLKGDIRAYAYIFLMTTKYLKERTHKLIWNKKIKKNSRKWYLH